MPSQSLAGCASGPDPELVAKFAELDTYAWTPAIAPLPGKPSDDDLI